MVGKRDRKETGGGESGFAGIELFEVPGSELQRAAMADVVFEEDLGVSDFVTEVLATVPLVFGSTGFFELALEILPQVHGFHWFPATSAQYRRPWGGLSIR